jgi:hypothetical protein
MAMTERRAHGQTAQNRWCLVVLLWLWVTRLWGVQGGAQKLQGRVNHLQHTETQTFQDVCYHPGFRQLSVL